MQLPRNIDRQWFAAYFTLISPRSLLTGLFLPTTPVMSPSAAKVKLPWGVVASFFMWLSSILTLQELIQNAEDACATQVKFLYDKNSYGTAHLYDEELAQFQVQLTILPYIIGDVAPLWSKAIWLIYRLWKKLSWQFQQLMMNGKSLKMETTNKL